jgi:hypothetical protein
MADQARTIRIPVHMVEVINKLASRYVQRPGGTPAMPLDRVMNVRTGRLWRNNGHAGLRLGLVVRSSRGASHSRLMMDTMGLMQQLGAIPAPPQ